MAGLPLTREFRLYYVLLVGEILSALGSRLSGFAFGVWVYQRTGSASQFALITMGSLLPGMLLSPFAGALIDRWDRRRTLMGVALFSALWTLGLAALISRFSISIQAICLGVVGLSFATAFQFPAFAALTAELLPKDQLARANGLWRGAFSIAQTLGYAIAGVLLTWVHLTGVVVIDSLSFLAPLVTLSIVRPPQREKPAAAAAQRNMAREIAEGWKYVGETPGLSKLLLMYFALLLGLNGILVVFTPCILKLSSPTILGPMWSLMGIAVFTGSMAMGTWGGPKRKARGILALSLLQVVLLGFVGLWPSLASFALCGFVYNAAYVIAVSCCAGTIQSRIPKQLQGRIGSIQSMVGPLSLLVSVSVLSPLADRAEPLMQPHGAWSQTLGRLTGVGPAHGLSLSLAAVSVTLLLATLIAGSDAAYRRLDEPKLEETAPVPVPAC